MTQAAKKQKKRPVAESVGTATAVATLLGVGKGTVSRWRKDPRWPVKQDPPWSPAEVAEIRAFRSFLQEDRSEKGRAAADDAPAEPAAAPQEPTTAELAKRLAIARTEEAEHKAKSADLKWRKEAGLLVPRDQMDASLEALARFFVAELGATQTRLVTALPGEAGRVRSILEQEVGKMRQRMSEVKEIALEDAAEVDA